MNRETTARVEAPKCLVSGLAMIGLAAILAACGPLVWVEAGKETGVIGSDGKKSGTRDVPYAVSDKPTAPSITIQSVTWEPTVTRGRISVRIRVADENDDPVNVAVQFWNDREGAWKAATVAPVLENLPARPTRTDHAFVWDSLLDLGPRRVAGARLRVQATDIPRALPAPPADPNDPNPPAPPQPPVPQSSDWVSSGDFLVNNNTAPRVEGVTVVVAPSAPARENVRLEYRLIDEDLIDGKTDDAAITVEYSADGGTTWKPAADAGSGAGSEGLSGLKTAQAAGETHVFVWNSLAHPADPSMPTVTPTGAPVQGVSLRVTPRDYGDTGTAVQVAAFDLDNNTPPIVRIIQPGENQTVKGTVPVVVVLSDRESSSGSLRVEYRVGAGNFRLASPAQGAANPFTQLDTLPTPGVSHTFYWDSRPDLGNVRASPVVLRITPSDVVEGQPVESKAFVVNNDPSANQAPAAVVKNPASTPASPAVGDITIDYTLSDDEGDLVDVVVEYSLDNWNTAKPASEKTGAASQGTTKLVASATGQDHVFVWDSKKDLGAKDLKDARVRVTPRDPFATGSPATTGPFAVDNNESPSVEIDPLAGNFSGAIAIRYALRDAESDPADIVVEYSTDDWATAKTATESAGGSSQGTRAHTSKPAAAGGVAHVFVWDAS